MSTVGKADKIRKYVLIPVASDKPMSTAERAKIRKWILATIASDKNSNGVTIQYIKKFLDSKQVGLSTKPETKLILRRLLETGELEKKDGKYVLKKSKKKTSAKETKKSKSPLGKATTKKPSILRKTNG